MKIKILPLFIFLIPTNLYSSHRGEFIDGANITRGTIPNPRHDVSSVTLAGQIIAGRYIATGTLGSSHTLRGLAGGLLENERGVIFDTHTAPGEFLKDDLGVLFSSHARRGVAGGLLENERGVIFDTHTAPGEFLKDDLGVLFSSHARRGVAGGLLENESNVLFSSHARRGVGGGLLENESNVLFSSHARRGGGGGLLENESSVIFSSHTRRGVAGGLLENETSVIFSSHIGYQTITPADLEFGTAPRTFTLYIGTSANQKVDYIGTTETPFIDAITAIGKSSGTIFVRPGGYLISSIINVSSNIRIVGETKESVIFRAGGNNSMFNFFLATNSSIENCSIFTPGSYRGIVVDMGINSYAKNINMHLFFDGSVNTPIAFRALDVSNVTFEDITIKERDRAGAGYNVRVFAVIGSNNILFKKIYINESLNVANADDMCISIVGSTRVFVMDSMFFNSNHVITIAAASYGIYILRNYFDSISGLGAPINIQNNIVSPNFERNYRGEISTPIIVAYNTFISRAAISNGIFVIGTDGPISASASSQTTTSGVSILNNTISGNGEGTFITFNPSNGRGIFNTIIANNILYGVPTFSDWGGGSSGTIVTNNLSNYVPINDAFSIRGDSIVFRNGSDTSGVPSSKIDIVGGSLTIRGLNSGLRVGTTDFMVLTNGTIGIGTASPIGKFDVNADNAAYAKNTDVGAAFMAANTMVSDKTTIGVYNTDSFAVDKAGAIGFGSKFDGTNVVITYGIILGAKETTDSGVTSGYLAFRTRPSGVFTSERMRITSAGLVGIGATSPSSLLDVVGGSITVRGTNAGISILGNDDAVAQTVRINAVQADVTTADTFIDFRSNSGSEGTIAGTGVGGVIAYNTFTGSHYTLVENRTGLELMLLLEATGEKIPTFPEKTEYKDVYNSSGVWVGKSTHTYQSAPKGQIVKSKISNTKKSQAAWGFWGGQDKEGRDIVMSIGTGYAYICNTGVPINVGDYLISTDLIKGYVEKQVDDIKHNYTVAKSLENVVWKVGETFRKVAVTYQGG